MKRLVFLFTICLLFIASHLPATSFEEYNLPASSFDSTGGHSIQSDQVPPSSLLLNNTGTAGEIPIHSNVSPTGSKTYDVPIKVYPGQNGFQPQLSVSYNSQRGNGIMGVGWDISGLSVITRCVRSMYYDNAVSGVSMTNQDGFVLDGTRLIKQENGSGYYLYESETGNIKVKGYYTGNVMKYFEVFYPNGDMGTFGYPSSCQSLLSYPLTSLQDLYGNTIAYSYTFSNSHYCLTKILYNEDVSVNFQYDTDSRQDVAVSYSGGTKVVVPELLTGIICKLGSATLHAYSFTYSFRNSVSLLTQVGFSAQGQSLNPLHFEYGEDLEVNYYQEHTAHLPAFYAYGTLLGMKLAIGKLNYSQNKTGLIALPRKNPYYKKESEGHYLENKYTGNEKIFIYTHLEDQTAVMDSSLTTGDGFVDIMCADLDGKQTESIVKINNYVKTTGLSRQDRVDFRVYDYPAVGHTPNLRYTRSFNQSTVYSDGDGHYSVQPKYFQAGDFDGDGKMEIMALSVNHPFGNSSPPTKCMIYDLEDNSVHYQTPAAFNVILPGDGDESLQEIENGSDKFFVMDYDGDGKCDFCIINWSGTHVYTFDVSSSGWSLRQVANYSGLTQSIYANRDVIPGDYNGDGLTDLLVTGPSVDSHGQSEPCMVFCSKGDGQFEKLFTYSNGLFKHQYYERIPTHDVFGFVTQDVNGDGRTDVIEYGPGCFHTYIAGNNTFEIGADGQFGVQNPAFVAASIASTNSYSHLLCLENSDVKLYTYPRNDSKERMLTQMTGSLGQREANTYHLLTDMPAIPAPSDESEIFNPTYPFIIIHEPIAVITSSALYLGENQADYNSYGYNDAVFHRQGQGFCGFRRMYRLDSRYQPHIRYFDPLHSGVIRKEETPERSYTNVYDFGASASLIKKYRLVTRHETDWLTGTTSNSSFTYDPLGYPTTVTTTYPGGITVRKENTYVSDTIVGNGYNLGFLRNQITTTTIGGSSYIERDYIAVHNNKRKPIVVARSINGQQSEEVIRLYDTYGNVLSERVKPYTSSHPQTTTYTYDSHGRLTQVADPMGLTTQYTYDSYGLKSQETDHRGGVTRYTYDSFGRQKNIIYPDSTNALTTYHWSAGEANSIYYIINSRTGHPTSRVYYDALNREVRKSSRTFNGLWRKVDKVYDQYGNLQKESLPFTSSNPSFWNEYSYDSYNRLLSIEEPSGRVTSTSYSGNSITTTKDGIASTKTYDVLGRLVSVTDPAGTITYNLAPDGQPTSIVAPGNVTTTFSYDQYRRRTSIVDPSAGTTTYTYDTSGNIIQERNANGQTISNTYDDYNRVSSTTRPEFTTTYTYNSLNDLVAVTSTNGTSKAMSYDTYGRLETSIERATNDIWLRKDYTYASGNVSAITYTSQNGLLATENYTYTYGHFKEGRINNSTVVYRLMSENAFGQPTKIKTGDIIRTYTYTAYGLPTGRKATNNAQTQTYQDFSYSFDPLTHNLLSRTDNKYSLAEDFDYDDLNRLTSFNDLDVSYDSKGNILSKRDVGLYSYNTTSEPYAISKITTGTGYIPGPLATDYQDITYTSFQRPSVIYQNGLSVHFKYNSDYDRVEMEDNSYWGRSCYYLGDCYEKENSLFGQTEKLYLFGNCYDAPAVYEKGDTTGIVDYILRDYLGSITQIVSSTGYFEEELSYDAWGNLRDPLTWEVYSPDSGRLMQLFRGYCGHEHLFGYGLINMNARLYDPALGRFLSPDPYVQAPDFTQNFNRYSYCLNNPLKYVDETGENPLLIAAGVAALIGGGANLWIQIKKGHVNNFRDGIVAFLIGGGSAAISVFTGYAATGVLVGTGGGGFWGGFANGGIGSIPGLVFLDAGNQIFLHDEPMSPEDYMWGIMSTAFVSGLTNGLTSVFKGNNFWTGNEVMAGRGPFAINNTPKSDVTLNHSDGSYAKPYQNHHFATNKNKTYSPLMEKITNKYNLDLNDDWNIGRMPHIGRHPNYYHQWVLEQMIEIDKIPEMNTGRFLYEFNLRIIQPVKNNPEMLYKDFWMKP